MPQPPPHPANPGVAQLFAGFFSVGIVGFGGVMPWIRRMVVERRGWLTAAEFTDMLALCQFLPGPNVTNLAVCLGARARGVAGAVAAVGGLLAAPLVIIVVAGMAFDRYGAVPAVARGLSGLSAAAAGLVLATTLKIAWTLRERGRGRGLGIAIAGVAFAAVVLARLPLLPTLLVLVPLSVALHARTMRP